MGKDTEELGFKILANTKALLGYWDKNMVCRFANRAYEEWLGIKPEDIVNKSTLREFLGPIYDKHLPMIRKVFQGEPQAFEREFVIPGGGIRRAIVSYTPDIIGDKVEGFYVHAADIVAPVAPMHSGVQGVKYRDHAIEIIKTLQLNVLSRFPGIEQMAKDEGISQSKLKRDFRNKTGLNPFAYYRRLQMEFAHSYLKENRCSRKQMSALLNFANPSNFSTCYNNYLRERSLEEGNANLADNRYKIFIEQLPFPIAMVDNDLRVLAVSDRWLSFDSRRRQDIFGKTVFNLYPDIHPKWKYLAIEALKGRRFSSNHNYLNSSNSIRLVKWELKPWYNHLEEVGGLIVYFEDTRT
ncbi:PAS domain-containing protein [Desertivirga brevis]|uniref:PAS domain-containing protein n=1 Tax=Desertivirga brevis TaxID=2810310 RepID=UPI001A977FBD|nr:PAS domain-containing protein [Pedobacter sp. SYSU D00873]